MPSVSSELVASGHKVRMVESAFGETAWLIFSSLGDVTVECYSQKSADLSTTDSSTTDKCCCKEDFKGKQVWDGDIIQREDYFIFLGGRTSESWGDSE